MTESLLVQSVQIVNSGGRDASLRLVRPGLGDWKSAVVRTTKCVETVLLKKSIMACTRAGGS